DGVDAAIDDGDDLRPLAADETDDESIACAIETDGKVAEAVDRGARRGAIPGKLDLVREDRGAQPRVRGTPPVVVGQLGDDRTGPLEDRPCPAELAHDRILVAFAFASQEVGEA